MLFHRFATLSNIVEQDGLSLTRTLAGDRRAADAIIAAREVVLASSRVSLERTKVQSDDPVLLQYLRQRIGCSHQETLLAIHTDASGGYIAEDAITLHAADTVTLRPRAVFERALALGSRKLLLAHNHPSGAARASKCDVLATKEMARQAGYLEMILIDHLIVTNREVYSMRRAGDFI